MNSDDQDVLAGFAQRVNEICDDMKLPSRGRQTALAAQFKVTNKAARKWLIGLGYPEMPLAVRLANWANVNLTWLLQGAGPKRGNRVDGKLLILDEAFHSLPPDQGADLIDSLRAKLRRAGKLPSQEPMGRYEVMLQAYEQDLLRKQQ